MISILRQGGFGAGAGEKGDTGTEGEKGDTGVQGLSGDTGAGEKGDTGAGTQGDTGVQGTQGDTGIAGNKGDTGAGEKGDTGATGEKGDTGAMGDQGDTGVQGTQGDTGVSSTLPMIILTKSSSVNQDVGGVNGTEVWWTWDGEDKKDTGFTHSVVTNSERVQVDADGWYQIRFCGNVQQTGSQRTTLHGIIRVNGGSTERKGTVRDYTRGSAYGNLSPGLDCIMELSDGDYIEVGTRVEDTDATYTLNTNDGSEILDDENLLYILRLT